MKTPPDLPSSTSTAASSCFIMSCLIWTGCNYQLSDSGLKYESYSPNYKFVWAAIAYKRKNTIFLIRNIREKLSSNSVILSLNRDFIFTPTGNVKNVNNKRKLNGYRQHRLLSGKHNDKEEPQTLSADKQKLSHQLLCDAVFWDESSKIWNLKGRKTLLWRWRRCKKINKWINKGHKN